VDGKTALGGSDAAERATWAGVAAVFESAAGMVAG
jgi:hypothetical protein